MLKLRRRIYTKGGPDGGDGGRGGSIFVAEKSLTTLQDFKLQTNIKLKMVVTPRQR